MKAKFACLLFLAVLCAAGSARLAKGQACTVPGMDMKEQIARVALDSDGLSEQLEELGKDGYRPLCLCAYGDGAEVRFTGIWEKKPDSERTLKWGLDAGGLEKEREAMAEAGMRVLQAGGYRVGGGLRYYAIFEKCQGPEQRLDIGMDRHMLEAAIGLWKKGGKRPTALSTAGLGSLVTYTLVWEESEGPDWDIAAGLDKDGLEAKVSEMKKDGWVVKALSAESQGGKAAYAAVFEKELCEDCRVKHGLDADDLEAEMEAQKEQGYKVEGISAYSGEKGVRYTVLWRR